MLSDILTPEAHRENSLALQAALGINAVQAAEALAITVVISVDPHDPMAHQLAQEAYQLLSRTARRVALGRLPSEVDVEVVVGAALPRAGVRAVFVSIDEDKILIGSRRARRSRAFAIPSRRSLEI